jgi:hypothetical protein
MQRRAKTRIGVMPAADWCGAFAWMSAGVLHAQIVFAQAAEQKKPLIERLDDPTRTKVLAALAGLVILGCLLLALVWMGARFTRRYMNSSPTYVPPQRTPLDLDDWARKPLADSSAGGNPRDGDDD